MNKPGSRRFALGLVISGIVLPACSLILGSPSTISNADQGFIRTLVSPSRPGFFIENVGQFDPAARFQLYGGEGNTIWIAEDALWITVAPQPGLINPDPRSVDHLRGTVHEFFDGSSGNGVHLRLAFLGANPEARIEPFNRLEMTFGYFLNREPQGWYSNVPAWGGVRYVDLYPGIDLELSVDQGGWRMRAAAAPGAQVGDVRLSIEGSESLALAGNDLVVNTAVGDYRLPLIQLEESAARAFARPAIHGDQVIRPFVRSAWTEQLGLVASGLDERASLARTWNFVTYLGGAGSQFGQAIAADSSGAVYVAGSTYSSDFPTTPGAFQTVFGGGIQPSDAYIAKFTPDGSDLVYATFLGGSGDDRAYGIAVGAGGEVFVTGHTNSANFPTTAGAHQGTYGGGTCGGGYPCFDAFVTRLNAAGSGLDYSTYLGDDKDEIGWDLAVDAAGAAHVAGGRTTWTSPSQGTTEAYVKKLSTNGSSLQFTTWLDGSEADIATSVALGASGEAYVAGYTNSEDFPTTPGAFQTSFSGGWCGFEAPYLCMDYFVARLDAGTGTPVFSTYLGDVRDDSLPRVAVDSTGAAYITGQTESPNFPTTPGVLQPSHGGGVDVTVSKLSPNGDQLIYSTFRGGAGDEYVGDLRVNSSGIVQLVYNSTGDVAIEVISPDATALLESSSLGGGNLDSAYGIYASGCCIYVTGYTLSDDFPTTAGAYQTAFGGTSDAFVAALVTQVTPDYTLITQAQGFDTCEAPDPADLQTWRDQGSPYQYIGIYIGGSTRSCPQLELDAAWVSQIADQPWQFIPIWAGPQAPCRPGGGIDYDETVAFGQGVQEAQDAVEAAYGLGLVGASRSGTIIYYDIEPFDPAGDTGCETAVNAFISGWVSELNSQGNKAGVYGHVKNVGAWHTIPNVPDAVWFAAWVYQGITSDGVYYHDYDPEAQVYQISGLPDSFWPDNQRLRQYAGDHHETYGGVRLYIDSNTADGPVAIAAGASRLHDSTLAGGDFSFVAPSVVEPAQFVIQEMDLLSLDQGWVLANQRLLWTTTGGVHWTEITPPVANDEIILAVDFLDALHGWVMSITPGGYGATDQLVLHSTLDGGQTWQASSFDGYGSAAGLSAVHIHFIDPLSGWVVVKSASSSNFSVGALFATSDGGASWTQRALPSGNAVRFSTPDTGWTTGGPAGDQLYKTEDGGDSWVLQNIGPPAGAAEYVIYGLPTFENNQDGVIPVLRNDLTQSQIEFYVTSDNGQSWNLTNTTPIDQQLRPGKVFPLSVIDSSNWVMATSESLPNLPANIADLDFITPQLGWAYTSNRTCSTGVSDANPSQIATTCTTERSLQKTADGGETWEELSLPLIHVYLPVIQAN